MGVYLLYIASPVLVYLTLNKFLSLRFDEAQVRKILLVVCGIIMALMIGLRNPHVGSTDTYVYMQNWNTVQRISFDGLWDYITRMDMESGYLIFAWIFSHIFEDPQWLLVVSGAFFAWSVCTFVHKNCKNVILPLLVFNCLGLFNFMVQGLRQALAMCICLWAIEFVKKRKLFKFLLLVALACSFHASAIVFVLVYALYKLKLNTVSLFYFSVFLAAIVFWLPELFALTNTVINDAYEMGTGAESGGVIAILIYLAIVLFGITFSEKSNTFFPMFVYMAIISLVAMIMRNSVSTIVERISFYFSFAQMVLISNGISTIKDKQSNILVNIAVALLLLGVAVHKASYTTLVPYLFFWQ